MSPVLLLATLVAQHEHDHHAHQPEEQRERGLAAIEMDRNASGTAWQPVGTPHLGWHLPAGGDWQLMLHGVVFGGYDWQGGPRGARAAVLIGWVMAMARRDWEHGSLQLRAMLSPEAWTVRHGGYPLLLQTGETYQGQPLHDRQHPHDLFMELGALFTQELAAPVAVQGYAALAGEPALGPVAFPHRASAMADPLATLGHHWLDSTHISFGVLTLGVVGHRAKLEGSWFNGREPDERRWDLDLRRPDSFSGRLWLGFGEHLIGQVSYGHLASPEAHESGSLDRFTASLSQQVAFAESGQAATLVAFGLNHADRTQVAALAESTVDLDRANVIFARLEYVQKSGHDLVLDPPLDAGLYDVTSVVLGYLRNFGPIAQVLPGVGLRASGNYLPAPLGPAYGNRRFPVGAMLYVRLLPAPMHHHGVE
jgi:hypothetical protein